MAYLHEDAQTFNAAVARSAEALHLLPSVVAKGYYESDYRSVTRELLWEDVPYKQAISALGEIADFLDSSAATQAMAQLQSEMSGEAARTGITGDADIHFL